MIQYLSLIIEIILIFLIIFWISRDVREKEIDRKYYWIWTVFLVVAILLLGIIGLIIVALGYYLWSKKIH